LKKEALARIKWRNHFGRGCGPVLWQITDDDEYGEIVHKCECILCADIIGWQPCLEMEVHKNICTSK
jgi:hypothetical protein